MIGLARIDVATLAAMAQLFEYPGADLCPLALRIAREAKSPAVADHLSRFADEIAALAPGFVEEAHVRTFLVAPASAPYVGIQLFGEESFKRAHFMARLVERFRALGFDPGNELPDHVGVLLRFAPLLDAEELSDLARWCLALPVTAMRRALEHTHNPYRHLLAAVEAEVAADGVSEEVRTAVARVAQAADQQGCLGCSVQHGGDEL